MKNKKNCIIKGAYYDVIADNNIRNGFILLGYPNGRQYG